MVDKSKYRTITIILLGTHNHVCYTNHSSRSRVKIKIVLMWLISIKGYFYICYCSRNKYETSDTRLVVVSYKQKCSWNKFYHLSIIRPLSANYTRWLDYHANLQSLLFIIMRHGHLCCTPNRCKRTSRRNWKYYFIWNYCQRYAEKCWLTWMISSYL